MSKPADDFEAVKLVIEALEPFDTKDRERIIRWAAEKLGMQAAPMLTSSQGSFVPPKSSASISAHTVTNATTQRDIKSFVLQKNPISDNQMAAVVAYYHHFEAPPEERKGWISKEDLIDACRRSDWKRPQRPEQVLVNTYHAGLLDRTGTPGQYRLNSVGENLVAMVLPEQAPMSKSVNRKPVRKPVPKLKRSKKKN